MSIQPVAFGRIYKITPSLHGRPLTEQFKPLPGVDHQWTPQAYANFLEQTQPALLAGQPGGAGTPQNGKSHMVAPHAAGVMSQLLQEDTDYKSDPILASTAISTEVRAPFFPTGDFYLFSGRDARWLEQLKAGRSDWEMAVAEKVSVPQAIVPVRVNYEYSNHWRPNGQVGYQVARLSYKA